ENVARKEERNERQTPWADLLSFYSATVEQVCQTTRGISPQMTGYSIIITKESRTSGDIDKQESAWSQMPERGAKKRCVVGDMFDHVQEKNSVVVPYQGRCLVENVIDEKLTSAGFCHF